MKVYRVSSDQARFGALVFDGELLANALDWGVMMDLSCVVENIADTWPKCAGWFQSLYSDDMIESMPDVYLMDNVILVLSPRAKRLLEPELRAVGGFLPFDADGESYHLLMVHSVLPVDESRSEQVFEYGNMMGTRKLAFHSEDVGAHPIFKTEYDVFFNLYCTEKFKGIVEGHQLSGLLFHADLARVID